MAQLSDTAETESRPEWAAQIRGQIPPNEISHGVKVIWDASADERMEIAALRERRRKTKTEASGECLSTVRFNPPGDTVGSGSLIGHWRDAFGESDSGRFVYRVHPVKSPQTAAFGR